MVLLTLLPLSATVVIVVAVVAVVAVVVVVDVVVVVVVVGIVGNSKGAGVVCATSQANGVHLLGVSLSTENVSESF